MIHQRNTCDTYRAMNISEFKHEFLIFTSNSCTTIKAKITICFINRVGIEYTQGHEQNAYLAATYVKKEDPKEEKKPAPLPEASDTDSDSN